MSCSNGYHKVGEVIATQAGTPASAAACTPPGGNGDAPGGQAVTAYPDTLSPKVVQVLKDSSIPAAVAVKLQEGPHQVWQYLPRCPYCAAFVSPARGVCNNPRCRAAGHQVVLPRQWHWPPASLSLAGLAHKVPVTHAAWVTQAQAFEPEDYDWSTPAAALQSYDRMMGEVRDLLTLARQGGWADADADVYDQETWKAVAKRCRLALKGVDDETLKVLAYKQGFQFPTLIYESSTKPSALAFWLNPAYKPKAAAVVQNKALERWQKALETGTAQGVLDDEQALYQKLVDAGGEIGAGPVAPSPVDKYADQEIAPWELEQVVHALEGMLEPYSAGVPFNYVWGPVNMSTQDFEALAGALRRYLELSEGLGQAGGLYKSYHYSATSPLASNAFQLLGRAIKGAAGTAHGDEVSQQQAGQILAEQWDLSPRMLGFVAHNTVDAYGTYRRLFVAAGSAVEPSRGVALDNLLQAADDRDAVYAAQIAGQPPTQAALENYLVAAAACVKQYRDLKSLLPEELGDSYTLTRTACTPGLASLFKAHPLEAVREAAKAAGAPAWIAAATKKEMGQYFNVYDKADPIFKKVCARKARGVAKSKFVASLPAGQYVILSTPDGVKVISEDEAAGQTTVYTVPWDVSVGQQGKIKAAAVTYPTTADTNVAGLALQQANTLGAAVHCVKCGKFVFKTGYCASCGQNSGLAVKAAPQPQAATPVTPSPSPAVDAFTESLSVAKLLLKHPFLAGYGDKIQAEMKSVLSAKGVPGPYQIYSVYPGIGVSSGKSSTGKVWMGGIVKGGDGKFYPFSAWGPVGKPQQVMPLSSQGYPGAGGAQQAIEIKWIDKSKKYDSMASFTQEKKCPSCGHPVKDVGKECPKCFAAVSAGPSPAPASAPSSPGPTPASPAPSPSSLAGKVGKFGKQVAFIASMLKARVLPQAGLPRLSGEVTPEMFTHAGKADVGGMHEKHFYTDPMGRQWLFKPDAHLGGTRAATEQAASELFYRLGLDTPQVIELELGGQVGSVQPMLPGAGALDADPAGWTPQQREQVTALHVGRWLISEHDGKADNNVVMGDGKAVAIDLGQAYRFFSEDELSTTYHPNGSYGSGEPVHNTLWRAVGKGQVELDPQVIYPAIQRVEAMPEAEYVALLRPVAEAGSKSVHAGWHGRMRQAAAKRLKKEAANVTGQEVADEFLRQAVRRKRTIRARFETFLSGVLGKSFKFEGPPVQAAEPQPVAAAVAPA